MGRWISFPHSPTFHPNHPMHDPRLDQLARQLIKHSVSLKKGENVLIDLYDTPAEMGIALIRAARAAGGVPHVQIHDARVARELQMGATDRQGGIGWRVGRERSRRRGSEGLAAARHSGRKVSMT